MRRYFKILKKPEWIFLIIALLSGCGLCFLIPVESGFDELTHMARIWEISGGYLIPNQKLSQGPYLPAAFAEISYRNQFFYNPVPQDFFAVHKNDRIDWNIFIDQQTRSVYSPFLYLPQAFAVGLLGRLFDSPVLMIIYSCRMLYLLGYIFLTFIGIRLIPYGKWIITVLALAPMAMYQAATITPDAYTNGACFLFIAWVLKLEFQENPIGWKQLWITIGITALLLSVKVNGAFLLPLFLLLIWKGFVSKKMLTILVGAVSFLFIGLVVGWNLIAYSKYYINTPGFGALGQLAYIIRNPFGFGGTFIHDIFIHGITYLRDWIAIYGYDAGRVPPLTYLLFGIILLIAWMFSHPEKPLIPKQRALLILTGIAGCLFTILALYVTFTRIGSQSIAGVQGRYFIPIMPALLLGLTPGREIVSRNVTRAARYIVVAGTVLMLSVYLLGVYYSFYVVCGTSLYTPGFCYQPQYKNWAPNDHFTQPVAKNLLLQQTFTAVCAPIQSIRVWSAPSAPGSTGQTLITLRDTTSSAVLAENLVNNQNAADHAWQEMIFTPIENAVGKQFTIEITSDLSDPAAGLSLGVTVRREYLNGIVINNVPGDFDLIFQYGCKPLTLEDVINQRKP